MTHHNKFILFGGACEQSVGCPDGFVTPAVGLRSDFPVVLLLHVTPGISRSSFLGKIVLNFYPHPVLVSESIRLILLEVRANRGCLVLPLV